MEVSGSKAVRLFSIFLGVKEFFKDQKRSYLLPGCLTSDFEPDLSFPDYSFVCCCASI
jgi:hypothetical protein